MRNQKSRTGLLIQKNSQSTANILGVYLSSKKKLGVYPQLKPVETTLGIKEGIPIKIIITPTPKKSFVRESYMMRERKPVRTVLTTLENYQSDHSYNISMKGAIKTHGDIAITALLTEFASLLSKFIFHPIAEKSLSDAELKAVIRSSCFVKEKIKPDGIVDKIKARVVAGGNQQDKSINTLDEKSSAIVSTAAVFVTVAIAAYEGRHVISMDVEIAD